MSITKILTVFTPTYNRAHTLGRLYESLKRQSCKKFKWLIVDDGSEDNTRYLARKWICEKIIEIDYIYKENGGLHTGYNVAYENIDTELCVCIDSDDFLPHNAVEIIYNEWTGRGSKHYAGLIGLDYNYKDLTPIGGKFPDTLTECYFLDLYTKRIHIGDTKPVMRTDLVLDAGPMTGYPNEKYFNPVYSLLKVCDEHPLLVVNDNLCLVDYQQTDSMSANIFGQYINSPQSFSKLRCLEMQLKRSDLKNRIRVTIHYIATSLIAKNRRFISDSPLRLLTIALLPLGFLLYLYIKVKAQL